ncbi:MAG: helix-turn-helix transcriptional regulator [Deltaproteobacteria bacterium]|nr:helix-turn-helix transcriptional regulator [Deltaproteobacteria bacterium]
MNVKQIKILRIQKGWKQIDLAKKTQIDQAQISRLENGHVKNSERYSDRIFKAFGLQEPGEK